MQKQDGNLKEFAMKARDHVVDMMLGKKREKWDGGYPMYEGVCGWSGVMAPLNRPAFVAKFGEDFTKAVEMAAREELARRADFWANSEGRKHTEEASEKSTLPPSALKAGDFVFGRMMCLKCEGPFRETLSDCINWVSSLQEARLCKIERIIECEDVVDDKIEYRTEEGKEGGSESDDMTDEMMAAYEHNFQKLPKEYQETFYTKCALVRDKNERYYLIDFEGYSYARYIIVPVTWEAMYSTELDEIKAEKARKEREAEEAKAKAEAEARAAYDALCAKWEGLMTPVVPQKWGTDTETGKKNVLAMAKAAFPWVRFWVSYSRRWGHGYTLKWTNGPTVDELKAATNFGLFKPSEDTFDGMTDYSGVAYAKFTDFADKFGGVCNGVEFDRRTAETDLNRDPNKPQPPKPEIAKGGSDGNMAEVRENTAKNGIEIYFPAKPSETIREEMKASGFRWSRFAKVWYNRATDENREVAARVVAKYNEERAAA